MIVSVIGNSNMKKLARVLGKSDEEISSLLSKAAKELADSGNEIMIVPEGSQAFLARAYKAQGGKKVIGTIPEDDKIWGCSWIDKTLADENVNCGTWIEQPYYIMTHCDAVVVFGYGPGTVSELLFLKYAWKAEKPMPKVYLVKEFLRGTLPAELAFDFKNIEYVMLSDLKAKLANGA